MVYSIIAKFVMTTISATSAMLAEILFILSTIHGGKKAQNIQMRLVQSQAEMILLMSLPRCLIPIPIPMRALITAVMTTLALRSGRMALMIPVIIVTRITARVRETHVV